MLVSIHLGLFNKTVVIQLELSTVGFVIKIGYFSMNMINKLQQEACFRFGTKNGGIRIFD